MQLATLPQVATNLRLPPQVPTQDLTISFTLCPHALPTAKALQPFLSVILTLLKSGKFEGQNSALLSSLHGGAQLTTCLTPAGYLYPLVNLVSKTCVGEKGALFLFKCSPPNCHTHLMIAINYGEFLVPSPCLCVV